MYGPSAFLATGAGVDIFLNPDFGGVGFQASLIAVVVLLLWVGGSLIRLKINERRLRNKGKTIN